MEIDRATSNNGTEPLNIAGLCERIRTNIHRVIVGKDDAIELLLVCLLCEGHALIEDVPGVGKTSLARALASSIGGEFRRIQCTPDLLPSDITGISLFDQKISDFRFRAGPVFANVVLADEINRATPRSQSALLEAMEERTVTVDGETRQLPRPFVVLATENPIELEGTFPLPEAQLDRFLMKVSLGYPEKDEEDAILTLHAGPQSPTVGVAETSTVEIQSGIQAARSVHADADLRGYVTSITRATREHEAVSLGASPRASLALFRASQALALVRGRQFVTPDDVKELVVPVLGHRVLLSPDAQLRGRNAAAILSEVIARVDVPVEGTAGVPR